MKNGGRIIAIAMLLALLTSGVFAITSCGTNITSSGSYVMDNAISDCSGNCIDIQADNVTLDCQGYTMNQICAGNFVFLYTENRSNITVKNCIIESWYDGIVFNSTNNSFIQNVTTPNGFGNGYAGIRLVNSSHNTISEVSESSNVVMGLIIQDDSDYNLVKNSTFDSNSGSGIDSYIEFSGDGNDYNTYTDLNFTNTVSSAGIQMSNGTGNVINNIYAYNNPTGLILSYLTNSSIDNITVDTCTSFAFALGGSSNITASNLNITTSLIGLYLFSTNDSVFTKVTSNGATSAGLYFSQSSKNNVINGITLDSNAYGIYMNNATLNTIKNAVITNSVTNDLRQRNNAQDNVFLNASMNPAAVTWATCAVCNFTLQWYAQVSVSDGIDGFPGKVNVSDVNGQSYFAHEAQSDGLTISFPVSDYTVSRNGTTTTNTSFSDYTINASYHGSDLNTTTYNFSTADNVVNMTVYPSAVICETMNESTNLGGDLSSSGTCMTFGADNVILDCKGYSITGDTTGVGVYANTKNNVTIKNCNILNYSKGIEFYSTTNSFILDTNLSSHTYGIWFYPSSENNTLTNLNSSGNGYGILLIYLANNNIFTNIITNDNQNVGLWLEQASENNVFTNITSNNNGLGAVAPIGGIFMYSASDGNTFTKVEANDNDATGIFLEGVSSNVFTNVVADSNVVWGMRLTATSDYNSFTNINITNNEYALLVSSSSYDNITNAIVLDNDYGIQLLTSFSDVFSNIVANNHLGWGINVGYSAYNTFDNVTTNNNGVGVQTAYSNDNTYTDFVTDNNSVAGISTQVSSSENFTKFVLSNNDVAIRFTAYAYNHRLVDSTITSSTSSDINSTDSSYGNTILNTTFDPSKVTWESCAPCNFTVQWWGRVNTTNETDPLPADVNVSDVYTASAFSGTAGANGLTSWLALSDYVATDTTNTSFNPHDISVGYAGYGANSTSFTFDYADATVNLTLYAGAGAPSSACGSITESTTLLNNLTSNDTCITFDADNIELDCNGYSITGILGVDTYGVYAEGRSNVTVRNCIITNFGNGIFFNSTSDSFIYNSTATSNSGGYGVYLYDNSNSNTIENIIANSNTDAGIFIYLDSNYNSITNASTDTNGFFGIALQECAFNNITNVLATTNLDKGLYLTTHADNNIFTNINVTDNAYGVYLEQNCSNNSFTNVEANSETNNGITLYYYNDNNTFTNVTANTNYFGIYNSYESNNNRYDGIIADSNTFGLLAYGSSVNNVFHNFALDSNTYAVYIYSLSNNNTFSNGAITTSTNDLYMDTNVNDNYILNTTYNPGTDSWSSCASCNYTRQWYARVNVTNATDPLPADVNISDVNTVSTFSGTAGIDGLTAYVPVNDYVQMQAGSTTLNPNEINASYAGYDINSTSFTFDYADATVNLTLYEAGANVTPSTCGTITESTTLNQNLTSSGTCITFGADNIELDCAGYSITGDTTGYGIVAGANTNITVKNCKVYNFSTGIYFVSTSDSFISNVISENSVNGIYLETSSNNNINNATVENNQYGMSVYLSSNNNVLDSVTAHNNANWGFSFYTTSNNNNLTDVNVSNNLYGLYVYDNSNDNIITNIEASNTPDNGIIIESSFNNVLSGITAMNNTVRGVYLVSSSNNTLTDVLSNGIWLTTSSNNTFTNVISNDMAYGIGLVTNANYNSFTNLTANNNTANGIYLYDNANFNNFTDITININNNGIYFETSSNNRITNAIVNGNQYGIPVYLLSNNNVFTNLTANFNVNYGLTTVTSISNTSLTDIIANNNGLYGIVINVDSVDTTISNIETSNNGIYGLYAGFSNNTDVTGITANNNTDSGIYLEGSNYNDFSGITTLNNGNKGILLWTNSNNNTFKNAIAQDIYAITSSYNSFDNITSSDRTNGIEIVTNSYYNTVSNFTALNNTLVGVLLRDNANYNNISNIISNDNDLYGVWVYSPASNNIFTNVTTNNNTVHGFYIFDNSNDNVITDITANDNLDSGIIVDGSVRNTFSGITALNNVNKGINLYINANNNTFKNAIAQDIYAITSSYNSFDNITSNDRTNGIELVTNSNYNSISNFTALNNTLAGVNLRDNANFNNFTDSSLQDSTTADIYSGSDAQNNLFLNTTFNASTIVWDTCAPCNFTVQWYGRVNVTNSTSPLPADVNVSNVNGESIFASTAGIDGLTSWFTLTDYIASSAGNTDFNPHEVNASYSGVSNTTSFNFTGRDETAPILLGAGGGANVSADTCGTLLASKTLNNSLNSSETCIIIGADNIELDCAGYSIIGNRSVDTDGINATGRTNVTVKNCYIENYTYGVFYNSTTDSFIDNVTAYNNSNYGVYLQYSHRNAISNINSSFNDMGIYLIVSDNNTIANTSTNNNSNSGTYLHTTFYNTIDNATSNSNVNLGLGIALYTPTIGGQGFNNVSNVVTNDNKYGVYLSNARDNYITNVSATNNANRGIILTLSANNTFLNTTTNGGTSGIDMTGANNTFTDIVSNNHTSYGIAFSSFTTIGNSFSNAVLNDNAQRAISASSGIRNSFNNMTIDNSSLYAIYQSNTNYNNYSNITITNSGTADIYSTSNAQNNTFTNVSFSYPKVVFATCAAMCNATFQFYGRVNVTNSSGAGLSATATANDTYGTLYLNEVASGGLTSYFIANDVIMSKAGAVLSNQTFNPYNVSASLAPYNTNSTSFTFSYPDASVGLILYENVTPDITSPVITFVSPTDLNATITRNYSFVNISSNELLSNAMVNWNGTWYVLSTLNSTNWFRNMTSLADGNYTFYVTANDTSLNPTTTNSQWVNVSTYVPPAPYCGDAICNGIETSDSCPADCPVAQVGGGGYLISNLLAGKCTDGTKVGVCSSVSLGDVCSSKQVLESNPACEPIMVSELPVLPSWWSWNTFAILVASIGVVYFIVMFRKNQ